MLGQQLSVDNEDTESVPEIRIVGLGFYTTPGGTSATGFRVDEVSVSSERRTFIWEQVITVKLGM